MSHSPRKIELLAPAKDYETGIAAINHGADAGGCIVSCREQFSIRGVIKFRKHITHGICHCSYTAKVVGDVVVGLPTATIVGYPATGNGKALGHDIVILYFKSQRACVDEFLSAVAHRTELGAVTKVTVVDFCPV